jgi:hypothetical protein
MEIDGLIERWQAALPHIVGGQREIVQTTIAALSSLRQEVERLTRERDELHCSLIPAGVIHGCTDKAECIQTRVDDMSDALTAAEKERDELRELMRISDIVDAFDVNDPAIVDVMREQADAMERAWESARRALSHQDESNG